MSRADVVVVGSLNADVLLHVAELPGPGETRTTTGVARAQGGKGANAAAAAAVLGARVALVGMVGDDAEGREARAALAAAGVDVDAVGTARSATGTAHVVLDEHGENLILVTPGANGEVDPARVTEAIGRLVRRGGVVLADLEVPVPAVAAAARAAAEAGARFVLDPAPARPLDPEILAACDVLTPNAGEAATLAPGGGPRLLELGAGAVVVTRGREGSMLLLPGHAAVEVAPFPVTARDSTGAGDAFAAALAVAVAEGAALPEAAAFAGAAGALATRAEGARGSLGSRAEVQALLDAAARGQASTTSTP